MKKLTFTLIAALSAVPSFADNISDGLSISGDHVYSYTPIAQALGYAIAAVIGLIGAYVVYLAYINNSPDIRKKVTTWGCSCLAMLSMIIGLPQFFNYQESGFGGNGVVNGGSGGSGNYAGGDNYGKLDPSIPDIGDKRWMADAGYIPVTVDNYSTTVSNFLSSLYDHFGGGQPGTYGRTIDYITGLYNRGSISSKDYQNLMTYAGNLPHS